MKYKYTKAEAGKELYSMKRSIFVRLRAFGLQNDSNFFIQNLSVLIGAGMSVSEALQSVYAEVRGIRMKSVLREIIDGVDEGLTLSSAIERTNIISPHTLALIKLGELSGRLSENLEVTAIQNEKEATFRSRVRSALAYSSFVLIISLVVGVGVAWFVLPKISKFFADLNAPLPKITKIIIAVGDFLQVYGFIFIPMFIGIFVIMFYFLFSFPKTKFIGHTLLFHMPIIKHLILETEVARFGFLSGTMIRAGVPLHMVFELLPGTTTFKNYAVVYSHISDEILDGASFQKIFSESKKADKLIPLPVRQMMVAAEQSGALAETLIKIGGMYEAKVDATSRNIPAFLEPALLLFIGGLVGLLAVGILMPIYQLGLYF
ncbi:type II secretion system F family protein [Arenimonas sp.]|nr:type II secretion system F family protein [Candidatus Parcubacteria bacterium]